MLPTCNVNPYECNESVLSTVGKLGALYSFNGMVFECVKNNSADTDAVAGYLAVQMIAGGVGGMTMKDAEAQDGTLGSATRANGMWMYAVEFGNYGYILRDGYTVTEAGVAMLATAGGVAAGDPLTVAGPPGTLTFLAELVAATQEHTSFGEAIAADTADNVVIARVHF